MGWEKFRKDLENEKKTRPFHHRHMELDFALKCVPDMSWAKTNAKVLDVGCCESQLIYEIKKRGYDSYGIDIREFDNEMPGLITVFKDDITDSSISERIKHFRFYFIVSVSTIEHIGLPAYGGKETPNGDRLALENIHKLLSDEGFFIMTVPTPSFNTNTGRGYTYKNLLSLADGLFDIPIIEQRGGQWCLLLTKR